MGVIKEFYLACLLKTQKRFLPGGNSAVEPPDSIPNSEVKRSRDDGSVADAMRE